MAGKIGYIDAYKYDKKLMQNIIKRAEAWYSCKRGPRPSGALFVSRIGAVDGRSLFDSNRQTYYGDVRPPVNSLTCIEAGCLLEDGHCVRNLHAEVDAILKAAKNGVPTEGGAIYSINKPCFNCTKVIIAAGITMVFYAYTVYDEQRTQDIIQASGIEVCHVALG